MSCADPRASNGKCTGSEFMCMQGPVCWEDAMTFEPTHEFRGLKLERASEAPNHHYPCVFGMYPYLDEMGNVYYIHDAQLSVVQPTPKPGEVWKYVGSFPEKRPLLLILNEDEVRGIDSDRDLENITRDEITRGDWVKVLNADGSPA